MNSLRAAERLEMSYSFFSHMWRSRRSFVLLQISIMAVSLMPLVLVQQAAKSMIEEIVRRTIETSGSHIAVAVFERKNTSASQEIQLQNAKKVILSHQQTKSAHVEIAGGGILRKNTLRSAVTIRGVDPLMLQEPARGQYMRAVKGSLSLKNEKSILIGESVARDLGAGVGDTVLLLTSRGAGSAHSSSFHGGGLPKITRFTVAGIFSAGYEALDRSLVIIPLAAARSVLSSGSSSTFIRIKISDPFMLPNPLIKRSKQEIQRGQALLSSLSSALKSDGSVDSWFEEDVQRYSLFIQTQHMLSTVMLAAVLLAAAALSSTTGMRVIDLETDIAVLKVLGSNPQKLEAQLFLQGLYAGIMSAGAGIAGGAALHAVSNTLILWTDTIINAVRRMLGYADEVHVLNREFYLQRIPFTVYWLDLLIIALFTIAVSVLSACIPARRLRNISALQIIRRH